MSYSEAELAQISWEDIAVHMHYTVIQRQIVAQCQTLVKRGDSGAEHLLKRLRRNSVNYIYWLKHGQDDTDPLDNTAMKEVVTSRQECENDMYLMHMHLQAWRRSAHEANEHLPMRA